MSPEAKAAHRHSESAIGSSIFCVEGRKSTAGLAPSRHRAAPTKHDDPGVPQTPPARWLSSGGTYSPFRLCSTLSWGRVTLQQVGRRFDAFRSKSPAVFRPLGSRRALPRDNSESLADLLIRLVRAIRANAATPAQRLVLTDAVHQADPRSRPTWLASRKVHSWFDVRRESEQSPTRISNSEGQMSDKRIAGVVPAAFPDRRSKPPPKVRGLLRPFGRPRCGEWCHGISSAQDATKLLGVGSSSKFKALRTCGVYLGNGPKRQGLDLAVRSD